jgi:hypothetical protein
MVQRIKTRAKASTIRSQPFTSSLHRLIFPEKEDLFAQWHNAGPDVIMTIQLIEFYFCRMTKNPVAGKLESYFAPNLSD